MNNNENDAESAALDEARASVANTWQMLLGISQASSTASRARLSKASIPFTLITGFLGAGKTTLLNHLLADPQGRRIAVIVNDFGSINIDAALVNKAGSTASSWQLENGCVCCTLAAGLLATLVNLLTTETPPDHIVLEASGVAEPMGIIQTVLGRAELELSGVVCVVDADAVHGHLSVSTLRSTIERQLRFADLVLLNKIDLASENDRTSAKTWLEQAAPRAGIIETDHSIVPADIVLGFNSPSRFSAHEPGDTHDDPFESMSLSTNSIIDERRICEFGREMPVGVLRAKGLLRIASDADRLALFEFVGRRWSLRKGISNAQSTRSDLVFIGLKGNIDADELRRRFDTCTLR